MTRIVHIEKHCGSLEEDPTVVTAHCGAQGLLWNEALENEGIDPPDFDFVLPKDASQADCVRCIASLAVERATRTVEEPVT